MKKVKDHIALFLRFAKPLFPYKKKYLAIIVFGASASLLALVPPYLTKLAVDGAIKNRDFGFLILLAVIGSAVFIISGLIEGARHFLDRSINIKVKLDLNRKTFRHIEKLPFSYFKNRSTGEQLYRVGYDVDRTADFVTASLPEAVALFPRLIVTLVIVFMLNWKMAVFSIILAPILYLPPYYFSRKMRTVWGALIEGFQDIFKNLGEFFSHIALIKAFAKENAAVRGHISRLIKNIRIGLKNIKLDIASSFTLRVVTNAVMGLIAFYGGYMVIKNEMTLGTLSAIMVYLLQLMGLQGQFANFFQTTAIGLVSCERLAEMLDEKKDPQFCQEKRAAPFNKGGIVFKNITFGYKTGEAFLKDISFSIESGRHIALAGPSGCGKTTILYLLLGLYRPWQGDILVDGHDIKTLKPASLKGQIGIVLQEPFLWNDSIEYNIRYGKKDLHMRDVIEAAEIAGADSFINSLPQGYDTVIGENACKLSEGQKQRIAVARALVKRPKVMIFDEAFSSIDLESEEKIMRGVKASFKDTTLISVSHRLSTVMEAQFVYFLDKEGKIAADTPSSLMNKNREFSSLFSCGD